MSFKKFGTVIILSAICITLNASAAEKVTLVTLDWAPYIGKNLKNKGYVYQIVAEAFKRAGYDVTIQFYPWERALRMAKSGQADGLFPEYYDSSRLAQFAYSKPFPGGPVGFYIRKDSGIKFTVNPRSNINAALRGLKQYKFGIVRGYVNTKAFDDAKYLTKETADSDEQNLQKLNGNRVQLIFIDKYVANYLIRSKFPQFSRTLTFLNPPLEVKPLYIVFSKRAPGFQKKRAAFNMGLAKIKADGSLRKIMRANGF